MIRPAVGTIILKYMIANFNLAIIRKEAEEHRPFLRIHVRKNAFMATRDAKNRHADNSILQSSRVGGEGGALLQVLQFPMAKHTLSYGLGARPYTINDFHGGS
jgi:hypothetical protein